MMKIRYREWYFNIKEDIFNKETIKDNVFD